MRIELEVPDGWRHRFAPGRDLYDLTVKPPHVTLEVGPMVPREALPDDIVALGLPRGGRLDKVQRLERRTARGWPMQLTHALLLDEEGRTVECRLVAAYTFLVYGSAVVARAPDVTAYERHRAEILAVLRSARPRFRRAEPATIAELWSMEVS